MTPTRLQLDLYEQLLAELKKSGVIPDKFFKRAAAKGWSTPNSVHPAFNDFDSGILLMTAIELTKDPSFAMRLGRSVDITSYGTLGFALMTCANLRESILLLLRYGKAFSLPHWEAHEHRGGLLLRLGVLSTAPEHIRPLTELCFAQLSVTGSSLYRGQIQGAELQFAFPKPAHSASYKFALNVDVAFAFDCQYSQLFLPAHALDTPVRTSDPSQYVVFHQQCEEMLRGLGRAEKTTSEVRRLLIQSAGQFPSIAGVADSLYMSERTLRRHLSRESNTFRSILEEVRNLLACEYLTKTDLAVGEIAHLLEYSETVNFRRAFLRWRGMTPSAYRQQARS